MEIIATLLILFSVIANFFMFEQIKDLKYINLLKYNSFRNWMKTENEKKKIYLKLYETTKQERDLYKIKFERAMRYIKKH
jgi:hypothetical protein